MKKIGKRLAQLRRDAGLSQSQLASRIGVRPNSVARWERDEREPTFTVAHRIAEALGCRMEELLTEGKS